MDNKFFEFETTPVGSLLNVAEPERAPYIKALVAMPDSIHDMLSHTTTAAYLRGLTKTHNLALEQAPRLAFNVFKVAVGEISLAQLPTVISTELKVANDKAQAIATDIEKELFAPIMLEYNQSLRTQKAVSSPSAAAVRPTTGAQNVLDLKQQMAARPAQTPTAPRPVAPLRPATPAPAPRPAAPKSVFPPAPPTSTRPPNVPW